MRGAIARRLSPPRAAKSCISKGAGNDHTEEDRLRVLAVARDRCPKCGAPLIAIHYSGVELEKCSRCQGVWLDRGELDEVISREEGFLAGRRRIFG